MVNLSNDPIPFAPLNNFKRSILAQGQQQQQQQHCKQHSSQQVQVAKQQQPRQSKFRLPEDIFEMGEVSVIEVRNSNSNNKLISIFNVR